MIDGIDELTNGEIYGRFFHFWPARDVNIRTWLGDWMKKGMAQKCHFNLHWKMLALQDTNIVSNYHGGSPGPPEAFQVYLKSTH